MTKIVPLLAVLLFACMLRPEPAAAASQQEINKKNVVAFYNKAINDKDYDAAAKYLGAKYTQHNPGAADGAEGLKKFIAFLREKFPNYHSDIKRVFADRNYVILHVHNTREPNTLGAVIVDIFRLDAKGKIVEHWDVRQEIPEKTANNNGMF